MSAQFWRKSSREILSKPLSMISLTKAYFTKMGFVLFEVTLLVAIVFVDMLFPNVSASVVDIATIDYSVDIYDTGGSLKRTKLPVIYL